MVFLKKKDIVEIIAPGCYLKHIPIRTYLRIIEDMGFVPRLHADTFGKDPFYAAPDEKRVKALEAAIMAPDSKGIWCLKGGYGTTRVLSLLTPYLIPPRPKVLIGLSDCTSLLFYAHRHWPWRIIHGPLLIQMATNCTDKKTQTMTQRLLKGSLSTIAYGKINPLNQKALALSRLQGPAMGGNLCLLHSAFATPWMPDLKETILFLEDVDETSFRVLERMHHLKIAGIFEGVKALILFDFLLSSTETSSALFKKAFQRLAEELPIPVFKGQGVGHGKRTLPVVLGAPFFMEKGCLWQVVEGP